MTALDRITLWQDDGSQKHWPCGNDTVRLVTASPDSPHPSHACDRHVTPVPFALSNLLRVQWASPTLAWRLFTLDA
jgi:hypothetical protein